MSGRSRLAAALTVTALGWLAATEQAQASFQWTSSGGEVCTMDNFFWPTASGFGANVNASSNINCNATLGTIGDQSELDWGGVIQVQLNPFPAGCNLCSSVGASVNNAYMNPGYVRMTEVVDLETDSGGVWLTGPLGQVCNGIGTGSVSCIVNENYPVG